MSTDKMRDEFIAWFDAPEQKELRMSCAPGWAEYVWRASRAELVIELPAVTPLVHVDFQKNMRSRCKKAIEAAGVRVKE